VTYKGGPERAAPEQRGAVYEYRTLDFGPATPPHRVLKPTALDAIRAAGGELWALFGCDAGIGMWSNQLICITQWADEAALEEAGGVVLAQVSNRHLILIMLSSPSPHLIILT